MIGERRCALELGSDSLGDHSHGHEQRLAYGNSVKLSAWVQHDFKNDFTQLVPIVAGYRMTFTDTVIEAKTPKSLV